MRQFWKKSPFLNNLGYMVAILDTLVEKGAVALELTFVILVITFGQGT